MSIPSGPLKFTSKDEPAPLRTEDEALLAFAAAGVTGSAVLDLDFSDNGGGNIIAGSIGRTIASGDALQTVALAVINDSGSWLVPRPDKLSPAEIVEALNSETPESITRQYEQTRVRLSGSRPQPSRLPIFNLPINQWSGNRPGSTVFLPINDLGTLYINGLLEVLNERVGAFIVDERRWMRPAGLGRFARSRGGHLDDDPHYGKTVTIRHVENLVTEFVSIEQGEMLQNMALMAEALGVGGFPHFANHEFAWFEALGFQMATMKASRYLGANALISLAAKCLGRDPVIQFPTALIRDGMKLLEAPAPPNFPSMRTAVEDAVARKQHGLASGAWKEPEKTRSGIKPVSPIAIEATIAYCEYVFQTYGRFPAYHAPFRTVMAYQASYLDPEFYDIFYPPDTLTDAHREASSLAKRSGVRACAPRDYEAR